jgi:K+-transporting ATPase A subunit
MNNLIGGALLVFFGMFVAAATGIAVMLAVILSVLD